MICNSCHPHCRNGRNSAAPSASSSRKSLPNGLRLRVSRAMCCTALNITTRSSCAPLATAWFIASKIRPSQSPSWRSENASEAKSIKRRPRERISNDPAHPKPDTDLGPVRNHQSGRTLSHGHPNHPSAAPVWQKISRSAAPFTRTAARLL